MSAATLKKDQDDSRARAAASEAASDARAEARDEAEKANAAVEKLQKTSRSTHVEAAKVWHNFEVNVWLTNFNRFEFGFWKQERNKGKSRQFTSDMDIYAEVIENGEGKGVIGYRKELWKDASGMEKRLVLKLFSESLNWRASMDMMVGRSLQQTLGAHGLPVTCFAINTNDDDFVVYLERSAHKWPLLPESFSFFLLVDGEPRFYELRRALINIGGDYNLLDQHGNAVGFINGALLTIGGKWRCGVRSDHADSRMMAVMKLFAGMVVFNGQARRHMRSLARDVHHGRLKPVIQRQENDLYLNPRRVR